MGLFYLEGLLIVCCKHHNLQISHQISTTWYGGSFSTNQQAGADGNVFCQNEVLHIKSQNNTRISGFYWVDAGWTLTGKRCFLFTYFKVCLLACSLLLRNIFQHLAFFFNANVFSWNSKVSVVHWLQLQSALMTTPGRTCQFSPQSIYFYGEFQSYKCFNNNASVGDNENWKLKKWNGGKNSMGLDFKGFKINRLLEDKQHSCTNKHSPDAGGLVDWWLLVSQLECRALTVSFN